MNSQNVAYNQGQLGSVYISSQDKRFIPPSGMVITSITSIIGTTQLDELIPSNDANAKFIGTTVVANGTGDGGTLYDADEAIGGDATGALDNIGSVALAAGITIYGRWSSLRIKDSVVSGIVVYFGY